MKTVAGWTAALAMLGTPALVMAADYDPCRNPGDRRIAVVYTRDGGGDCKGRVVPEKKVVCAGDLVQWSVVNTCDLEAVQDIRIEGLERVVEKCSAVRRLDVGGADQIRCRVRRGLREDVKQEYEVTGRLGKSKLVIDPELDIHRPR